MEWYEALAGILALLLVLVAIGLPLPFALAGAAIPFFWHVQDLRRALMGAEFMIWQTWFNYILLAVPLFVFLGELVGRSNIGTALYRAMHRGVRMPGSAAIGSVGACAGFGAVCGSSMIGALTIGGVALPEMLRLGYDRRLAAGVVAAGGTLSVLLPPSLILLYFGIITDTSIGQLFVAGVAPGLVMTLLFALVVLGWRLFDPSGVPARADGQRFDWRDLVVGVSPVLIIGFVIIASIYFGVATPTEAAAVAVVFTLLLAFAFGGLTVAALGQALLATMRTMGFLGLMLAGALLFGYVLNFYGVPQELAAALTATALPPTVLICLIILFYLVIGMFLEPTSMLFITLPTVFPIVQALGFDLVWFGIVFTITMEIAVLTPPVGLNLFVIQGLAPDKVSITDVIVGSLPFVAMLAMMIVLLFLFPNLALWLPNVLR
ncbi:TRAP transporter large permease [Pikeienuella piscinae]|uniref:TRAP transporter large permease protein n=1 Tax=Pikeienuella piscinae TaxID=2748098 RepID=A0A7L5C281_9RHOB|nr:TRAP transporter large permease [Pikeienuella piscinae]QIE56636.1 TRAP transporter large permease [Pikeienuella piscinae]